MKLTKKVLSFMLCILMLATSIYNDGWSFVYEQLTASAMAGHEQSYNDTRVELDFNKNWLFSFTDDEAAYMKGFDDSDWQNVDLPHDFSIGQEFTTDGTEAESGHLPGGTGWYRKWFNLYEYYTGDRVFLNFDGVYQHTYVYVNGKFVGENHYGYNSFSFEISDYLIHTNTSHNVIAVKVVNDLPNSRWYSGSGIYRDVTLTIAGPVHVALYGPSITTPDLHTSTTGAHVDAKIKMHNDTAISKIVTVEATVLDSNHNQVSETVISAPITIPAETEKEITLTPAVENPVEWSLENPELYVLKTVVKDKNGELIDEYHTTFGFRCMEWDADGGFMLNHKPVKLKGVCLHNDQGALGAAQEYEAIYRQVATLKDMGCNAIRTTHNPASKALIEICNELGMLVIVEFFDGWDASKNYNENDFSKYFNEKIADTNTAIGAGGQKWFQYVVEHAILRDEHNPCVIAWDVGNELCNITDGSQTGNYEEIVKSITNIVDKLDPSRVVMQGNNRPDRYNPDNAAVTMIDGYMDVIGGNYAPDAWTYVMNDASDPRSSKPFVATEAASAINSRGVYYTMGIDEATKQCTAYDTNAVSWGNEAAEAWYYTITNDWFSGEFIWTGFDYIGEPTPWNDGGNINANAVPNSSYFGTVDTAGFKKDSYYLYRSWWNNDSTTLHLVPGSWNKDKLTVTNGYVPVAVYSNAAKIELLLNGQVIATATSADIASDGGRYTYKSWTESVVNSSKCNTQQFYNDAGSDLYAQFYVKHEAGTLSVKAYDKNNNEITDTVGSVKSVSGTASQVAATVWNNENLFVADSTDYIYVEYEARDAYGNFMNDYNGTLSIKVDDSSARYAKIIGVDNGNPATTEKFQQKSVIISDSEAEIQMFNGRALVILRTTDEEGTINITATASDGTTSFSTEGITVTSTTESGIELTDEFEEVIRQNDTEYQKTLYDEYEVVKYHINKLEKPEAGSGNTGGSGDSGDSGETPARDYFEIYFPEKSETNGCIEEGYYAINVTNFLMTEEVASSWAMTKAVCIDGCIQVVEWSPEGAGYYFNKFTTETAATFEFIHQGGNNYYIKSKTTDKYLNVTYFTNGNRNLTLEDTPELFTVSVNDDGSVRIRTEESGSPYYLGCPWDVFCVHPDTDNNLDIWLYSAPEQEASSEPETPSEPEAPDYYEIYLANSTVSEGCVADGEYVVYNQNFVLGTRQYWEYGTYGDYNITDPVKAPAGSAYTYEHFNVNDTNELIFTHLGSNLYYIQNKSTGKYLKVGSNLIIYDSEPQVVSLVANSDGSILMYSFNYYVVHYLNTEYYYTEHKADIPNLNTNANAKMWLYSKPAGSSAPTTPTDTSFIRYTASADSDRPVADGDYALCNYNDGTSRLITGSPTVYNSIKGLSNYDTTSAVSSDGSKISEVSDNNVFTFSYQGNGKYYIQHKKSGNYISINGGNNLTLEPTPYALNIAVNASGDIGIYNDNNDFIDFFISNGELFSVWNPGSVDPTGNRALRLYSAPVQEDDGSDSGNTGSGSDTASSALVELYEALHAGIAENFAIYTRESFEALLRALENGVQVYSAENSTDSDYTAAAKAIRDAIDALEMDIKQINGTLFKYGYNNSGDTPDYSDGGLLMNNIAIRNMKNAILADQNLVRQIKEIIGYNDSGWTESRADEVLEGVAEAYARIYTLQFTGVPYNGSSVSNAASNYEELAYCTWPTVSLWNLWTKVNTHGENDPHDYWDNPIYDGASVQGLAGATLEKGVITSHSAYDTALSYANDGPNDANDITNYSYSFTTNGTEWKTVTLDYLEGISVYFPDLFTRENLDADGNVTTATKGQFAKYYWDAEFPIFISTDEYGVNTYHFDSKDTTHLVQSSFDDENQTVDMQLNEVGHWAASGPNSNSGFFPFNYKQGTTSYTGENAIYHYGFTFEHNFYIPKGGKHANGDDVIFNFSGDDDVYVYLDGVLVLDNGGLHGAREVTINFTNCTINYQFAMDVTDAELKGGEYECTYSYNKLVENHPDAAGYNADTVAALNKLHEVISDGQVHTLNFFYLERGASDSNCRMSFNLSETSEEVRIIDQILTLDYAHPVEYNIEDNNNISQAAIDNNVTIEYLGLCAVNEDVNSTYTFELPEIIVPFEENKTYTVDGMKYGTCTIDKEGNTSYTLNSMNMTEAEHFYVCAKITGDPTYAANVVYYQIEKTTFVPATSIYYEDTFDAITYTPGKVPTNYNNSENKFGIWQTKGMQETTLKQSADLTDSEANPYGYEENYLSFAEYSGGSSHFVDVSTRNNPNSKYSGGQGAAWPTVDFTFTGTGFDLISVSDCTTGVFNVVIKDKDNKTVRNHVVDTFYGYNYGQIYMDANGNPTFEASQTKPLYRSEEGHYTPAVKYYDENGAITDTPHYYDAVGSITENESDSPAYAYAFGWLLAEDGSTDTLYQIPVIKVTDLEYGSYSVKITPTFTSMFGHSETAKDGSSYYRLYLDAIKIFSPAGENDNIKDKDVKDAYATDDELYPSYIELKDMLIGADTLSDPDSEGQGIIFIDGIAALDNNLGTYKNAGPNNELYLAKDQAVAFEIWATAVPTDIQIGAKLACGKPALTVSYASKATEIKIGTATDIYYSLNSALPNDSKLTWQQITAADGNNYYTTGTVVIQNTGEEDSVLSITNLKWTFSQYGGKGYFRIPTPVEDDMLMVASTDETPAAAYSLMRMRTAALDVEQSAEPEVSTDADGNSIVSITLNTSSDVASLVITDENGNPVPPEQLEYFAAEREEDGIIEWTVNITVTDSGDYTFTVAGAYANGYTDMSKAVTVTVTVEEPQPDEEPDEDLPDNSGDSDDETTAGGFFEALAGVYRRLIEFFRALLAIFGIAI